MRLSITDMDKLDESLDKIESVVRLVPQMEHVCYDFIKSHSSLSVKSIRLSAVFNPHLWMLSIRRENRSFLASYLFLSKL